MKQQITPQDTLLALVKYEDYSSGDNFQYYYQTNARPNFQFTEYQQPIVVGGWHHEWSPGAHTLLLGGRIATEQYFSDQAARQLLLIENSAGTIYAADSVALRCVLPWQIGNLSRRAEPNLSMGPRHALPRGSVAGRFFQTQAQFTDPPAGLAPLFTDPVAQASLDEDFNRLTGYGYLTLEPLDRLWLIGGVAYDDITYPANFRNPPLSVGRGPPIPARAQGRARLEPGAAVHAARRLYQVARRRQRG